MIRVESITIEDFRGIRNLTLDFKGKNFAVCGPNGTGKSGVVDALEFVLTGNLSRLSGEGRGDISLREHAPHVDKRNDPGKARVKATITIPSLKLKGTVTIERSPKAPGKIQFTPNDPEVFEVLKGIQDHPEIVLSRRELIRYVLATPGKRAEEVQALLHLDSVEQVRVGLQRIANTAERHLSLLATGVSEARANLLRALEVTELTPQKILAVANSKRVILDLEPLPELTAATSLKDGMSTPKSPQAQRILKSQALADVQAADDAFAELNNSQTAALLAEVKNELLDLDANRGLASLVARGQFYRTGIDLIDSTACPFCDETWNLQELKEHVQKKIESLRSLYRKRTTVEKKITTLIEILHRLQSAVDVLVRHASLAKPALSTLASRDYSTSCKTYSQTLSALVPLSGATAALDAMVIVPETVKNEIEQLRAMVATLPEPTKRDAAREWLTVAQERLEVWREAMRKQKSAKEQAAVARRVSDLYSSTSDKVLTDMYAQVEKDFAELYRFVNKTDEDKFQAKLVPSMGKLGFNVDFYGRGFFPPGAYHSEGHQDGMGLCLYLALMRHLHGSLFTFSVLDDVLMSVDVGHRREVCALLKKEFPNTQFVMTTHDPIWLRHMKTEGLVESRSGIQFRSWDVDSGPMRWDDRDVWTEIQDYLKQNEVRAASALLRHYLEYISGELCHRLRAPVEFRGDAQYQLGELLPAAISRMKKLFGTAKDAASSWNQRDTVEAISKLAATFTGFVTSSYVEQWQINAAVHYNAWENLQKGDFEPVVTAFRSLVDGFSCCDCKDYLRVSPERETADQVRCECGKINLNLRKKGC